MHEISNLSLLIIALLVLIPVFVSHVQKLELGKDLIISSLRGFIQLLILGFFISYLFSMENWFFVIGYIFMMIIIASLNIAKRGDNFKDSFKIVLVAITLSVLVCLSMWVTFSIIPFKAQYLIPVGGMFTGTAMVSASVVLATLKKFSKEDMDKKLARKETIKIAMIPTVDGLKTMGLVQIPGTMTGMILAGADPFEAVKYQIFINFTLLVITSLTAIQVSYFVLKKKSKTQLNG